jgi:hypothetical protein
VLAGAGLAEEGVEGVVTTANGLVGRHLTIGLDPVFQAVQLPACIADLDTGLAHMDGDTFPLENNMKSNDYVMCRLKTHLILLICYSLCNSIMTTTLYSTLYYEFGLTQTNNIIYLHLIKYKHVYQFVCI